MTALDWPGEISVAADLRRTRSDRWPDVYPRQHPGPPAGPAAIAAAAGAARDHQVAELLSLADGWPDFFANLDLLSTRQLQGSAQLDAGVEILDLTYDEITLEDWPARAGLEVICAMRNFADVIAVDLTGPSTDGGHPVHWFGGGVLVESYPNFGAFFIATHDYLRRRLAQKKLPGQ